MRDAMGSKATWVVAAQVAVQPMGWSLPGSARVQDFGNPSGLTIGQPLLAQVLMPPWT